jgi:hypothetical protein
MRVFDAVSAGVQMIDRPKIGLSGDGRLHLLFTEYSLQNDGRPVGLYYSQSIDGGATWSVAELISEKYVQWSDIIYTDGILYRFWQEMDGTLYNDFYQISQDDGLTWTSPANIVVGGTQATAPMLSIDPDKRVHFLRLLEENDSSLSDEQIVMVQEWVWDGQRWESQGDGKKLNIKGNDFNLLATGGITTKGYLNLAIAIVHPEQESELDNNIMSIGRTIEVAGDLEAPPPIVIPAPEIPLSIPATIQATEMPLSTPDVLPGTEISQIQMAPTEIPQLPGLPPGDSPSRWNLVGYLFVGVLVLIIGVFVVVSRRNKSE